MADSLKRITMAKDAQFQDRCKYYAMEKAKVVMAQGSPNANELALSKEVVNGTAPMFDLAIMVISESTIGTTVDGGGTPVESDVAWAVTADESGVFRKLADARAALNG